MVAPRDLAIGDSTLWRFAPQYAVPKYAQFPTKTSFTANANQSNESVTLAQGKLIFTTVKIDFYHCGKLIIITVEIDFLPPWKLIFTTVEIDFYHHAKLIYGNLIFHLGKLILPPWKFINNLWQVLSNVNKWKYLVSIEFFMLIIWKSTVMKIPIVYANMKGSENKMNKRHRWSTRLKSSIYHLRHT